MTTPLPSRTVPSVSAVKASSGMEERTATTDRRIGSIFMLLSRGRRRARPKAGAPLNR
ncbi:hypothetical protein RHECNPAF_1340045 [Rhizobium etli CNPAF512]|nr:hypothetical protein RHECNPAF_1340045 [Rhizobium etli CNPAF512]